MDRVRHRHRYERSHSTWFAPVQPGSQLSLRYVIVKKTISILIVRKQSFPLPETTTYPIKHHRGNTGLVEILSEKRKREKRPKNHPKGVKKKNEKNVTQERGIRKVKTRRKRSCLETVPVDKRLGIRFPGNPPVLFAFACPRGEKTLSISIFGLTLSTWSASLLTKFVMIHRSQARLFGHAVHFGA
ncbi:hypothetical protein CEXT_370331 [Caerostris extrusa]|uniref:Uncharacterized protein n=1 Tax=Caerostris extrusa TaxID=172846 RepID=A0AAV4NDH6_CAEEX|nr:hypothetical protein CEXT_370331 [Caerostris extrusa]